MHSYFFDVSVVIIGAALLSWLAHLLKQPIILAYLVAGALVGPHVLQVINDTEFVHELSELGITLLLFLAGVELHPRKLGELMRKSVLTTLGTCLLFFVVAAGITLLFGFGPKEAMIVGLALMFSSTILVLKLMPTVALHQRHMGAMAIAILIAQDLIAVTLLVLFSSAGLAMGGLAWLLVKGILLVVIVFLAEQFILRPIMRQTQRFPETLLLLAMAWCVIGALAADRVGLSKEVGAFIAGVSLARCPISAYIFEGLVAFRDFFLIFFFFALGAELDFIAAKSVVLPSLVLAAIMLVLKPAAFYKLTRMTGERETFSKEFGMRMGQCSEFSLLVAYLALDKAMISINASYFIQVTTLITMLVSSYIVVTKFPTPHGLSPELKQD